MTAIERLENLMIEDAVRQAKPSLEKMQELLLKIAHQQNELQEYKTLLAQYLEANTELRDRWDKVRQECGAETDDSVVEVFTRIRRQRQSSWLGRQPTRVVTANAADHRQPPGE